MVYTVKIESPYGMRSYFSDDKDKVINMVTAMIRDENLIYVGTKSYGLYRATPFDVSMLGFNGERHQFIEKPSSKRVFTVQLSEVNLPIYILHWIVESDEGRSIQNYSAMKMFDSLEEVFKSFEALSLGRADYKNITEVERELSILSSAEGEFLQSGALYPKCPLPKSNIRIMIECQEK